MVEMIVALAVVGLCIVGAVFCLHRRNLRQRQGHLLFVDDAPPGAYMPPTLASTLDQYEIHGLLGRGAYGEVVLARCAKDGKNYALKMISKSKLGANGAAQVMAERTVLTQVAHPFVIKLHACFQTMESLVFVLDYVAGGDMLGVMQAQPNGHFSEVATVFYGSEIALGIEYLHSCSIVYRDLKPENVLFSRQGHVLITDLGLAKHNIGDGNTTKTLCGTPQYAAPEVLRGRPYTRGVDWWCFGVLIYEMLAGKAPFDASDPTEMYKNCLKAKFVFPATLSPVSMDFIRKLCKVNAVERLGAGGGEEVRSHQFFEGVDFKRVLDMSIPPPPFTPVTRDLPPYTGQEQHCSAAAGGEAHVHDDSFAGFDFDAT